MTSHKDLVIKCSNRETPEKQIVKTDQNGNDETSKGEMEVMLPDNELYKFIEIQPITSIFREQVSIKIILVLIVFRWRPKRLGCRWEVLKIKLISDRCLPYWIILWYVSPSSTGNNV